MLCEVYTQMHGILLLQLQLEPIKSPFETDLSETLGKDTTYSELTGFTEPITH